MHRGDEFTPRRALRGIALGLAAGLAVVLLGPAAARAVCAGQPVPPGEIIYEVTTGGGCPGTLWKTHVPDLGPNGTGTDWACRPIGFPYDIPQGLIVSAVNTQYGACGVGAGSGTAWRVEQADDGDYMCAVWNQVDIPDGLIVTQVNSNYLACDTGATKLAFKLETPSPSGTTWGCRSGTSAVWDLPTNYVIIGIDNRTACTNGSSQLAWNIRIPVSANTPVCNPSPVPPGWVYVSDFIQLSSCAPSGSSGTGFRISPITDGEVTCSLSNIPSGFVVEDIKPSTVCGGTGYRMADLSVRTGNSYACLINAVPPPPTHVVVEADDYSRCAETGTAFGHKVALPNPAGDWACRHAAAPVPSNFIVDRIDPSFGACGAGAGSGLADHILVPIPGTSYTVCGTSPVPAGFFYTGSGTKPQCNDTFGYDIGPVAPGAIGCDPAQIPPDYVITAISASGLCAGNNYTVDRPETGGVVTNACTLSNTPPGFVWVGRTNFTACDAVVGLDYQMAEPDPTVGVNTNICQGSPVPPGFVYTGYLSVGACEGSTASDASIAVPDPAGTVVCSTANLPTGFVITSIDSYSQCGATAGAVVQYPNPTGTTTICNPSVPPDGYEIVATGDYGACGVGASSGPGAIIQPENQGLLPTPFVDPEPDVTTPPPPPSELCPNVPGTPIVISAPKNTAKCNW